MLNLHLSPPIELEKFLDGYLAHSNIREGEGRPCGGKNYFKYHPSATFNPYTGEIRDSDHFKKSTTNEPITLKKHAEKVYEFVNNPQVQQNIYVNSNKPEQELETMIIDPTMLLLKYLSNIGDEIYKKNQLYNTNKIYEGLKELIEKLSLYKTSKKSKTEKSMTKKKPKKRRGKEEVKEWLEKDELNFNDEEMTFLWNLWLLLFSTNTQSDRRFEFLRDFLSRIENPLENNNIHTDQL